MFCRFSMSALPIFVLNPVGLGGNWWSVRGYATAHNRFRRDDGVFSFSPSFENVACQRVVRVDVSTLFDKPYGCG